MSNANRSPVSLTADTTPSFRAPEVECQSCGRAYTEGPIDGAYSTVWGTGPEDVRTTEFYLCPSCSLQLVFEIGRGLPAAHFDVMAEVVEHEIARRREREGVAT